MFIAKLLYFNFQEAIETFRFFLIAYVVISVLFSSTYLYIQGPIQNHRYHKVIECSLKFLAVVIIYMGMSARKIFFPSVIGLLIVNFTMKFKNLTLPTKLRNKLFPVKCRLLTQEEYNIETDEFTKKQLKDLKIYCRSPECNSWEIINRLKNPER